MACPYPRQFKCRQSGRCIPTGNICNGIGDCPLKDDEFSCQAFHEKCPKDCTCLLFTIRCTNWKTIYPKYVQKGTQLHYVKVSIIGNANLSNILSFMRQFNQSLEFELHNTNISNFCVKWQKYSKRSILRNISLSKNNVTVLSSRCFDRLQNLELVNLSHNSIHRVGQEPFYQTVKLRIVDISYNDINHLSTELFVGNITLKVLNLRGNMLHTVGIKTFKGAHIRAILTDSYKACCFKPSMGTTCDVKPDWPNSCGNLIKGTEAKTMIWLVGTLGLLLNSVSIFPTKINSVSGGKNHKLMVRNIAFGDTFLCLYMLSIAFVDSVYQGDYVQNDYSWRGSWGCFTSCALFITSHFTAIISMHLITISRYCIVKYPVDSKYLDQKFILSNVIIGFIVATCMSTCLVVLYKFLSPDGIMPTGLCLLIGNIDQTIIPILVTWLDILSQGIPIVTMPILYSLLIYEKWQSDKRRKALIGSRQRDSSHGMIVRLILASFSNLVCWIASTVLLVLTFFWPEYPYPVLVWTTIIVLPLNSLINPFVFVFSKLIVKNIRDILKATEAICWKVPPLTPITPVAPGAPGAPVAPVAPIPSIPPTTPVTLATLVPLTSSVLPPAPVLP